MDDTATREAAALGVALLLAQRGHERVEASELRLKAQLDLELPIEPELTPLVPAAEDSAVADCGHRGREGSQRT